MLTIGGAATPHQKTYMIILVLQIRLDLRVVRKRRMTSNGGGTGWKKPASSDARLTR
jgi:hypothetical protein